MSDVARAGHEIAPVVSLARAREQREQDAREADDRLAGERHRAENISMHALGRRALSRREVADLLRARELPAEVVEGELDRLEGVGLIDDHDLATTLVQRLTDRKKLGRSALSGELQRRKLDAAAIASALADFDDEVDTDELIDQLVADRWRRMGSLDRATAERRLIGFLQRKGHGGSAAFAAVRRVLDGAGSERRSVEFE